MSLVRFLKAEAGLDPSKARNRLLLIVTKEWWNPDRIKAFPWSHMASYRTHRRRKSRLSVKLTGNPNRVTNECSFHSCRWYEFIRKAMMIFILLSCPETYLGFSFVTLVFHEEPLDDFLDPAQITVFEQVLALLLEAPCLGRHVGCQDSLEHKRAGTFISPLAVLQACKVVDPDSRKRWRRRRWQAFLVIWKQTSPSKMKLDDVKIVINLINQSVGKSLEKGGWITYLIIIGTRDHKYQIKNFHQIRSLHEFPHFEGF